MSEPPLPPESLLGVAPIDGEHSFQITLLRALKDACTRDDRKQSLELVNQLDDYTNMHFLFEETLMIQCRYPNHDAHRREHEHLIAELRALRGAVTGQAGLAPLSAAGAIEQWLMQHIQTFDRAFAAFLEPAKPAPE